MKEQTVIRMQHPESMQASACFDHLKSLAENLDPLQTYLSPQRVKSHFINAPYLSYHYACSQIDERHLRCFQDASKTLQIFEKVSELKQGAAVNISENRAVLHHQTRNGQGGLYQQEQARIKNFVKSLHSGAILSANQRRFTDVLLIGIGGSYLSVAAFDEALKAWLSPVSKAVMNLHYVANIDPLDLDAVLAKVHLEQSLIVVISKSGETMEVADNIKRLKTAFSDLKITEEQQSKQMVCVTCQGSPLDDPSLFFQRFYMDDAIGGRYSFSSAVGALPISLAYGSSVFEEILKGAFEMDLHADQQDLKQNAVLLDAWLGVYERLFLGYQQKAVIPYASALHRFPAHLQQLICESNGKQVSKFGKALDYPGSPFIFGEPGTQAQHSFFQQLHQGKEIVPVQFIGFKEPLIKNTLKTEAQKKLNANLIAQMMALAVGQDHEDANKFFPGNRPSTLLFCQQLSPATLGALLSFYENKTMFEGFILGMNSFDQEGVQLGKRLCKKFIDTKQALSPLEQSFVDQFLDN